MIQQNSHSSTRTGINKYKSLKKETNIGSNDKVEASFLPSGWYFNENSTSDVWDSLENGKSMFSAPKDSKITEQFDAANSMQETSEKVIEILKKLDEIEHETLFELQKNFDNNHVASFEDVTQCFIQAKNSVSSFISELNQFKDSQISMLESLKQSYNSLRNAAELNGDESSDDNFSNSIFIDLEDSLQNNIAKIEKVFQLHNDVSTHWIKRIGSYEKAISEKNKEVNTLHEKIDTLNNAIALKTKKKSNDNYSIDTIQKNNENQLRIIEEQKRTIANLRAKLVESELGRASAGLSSQKATEQDNSNLEIENKFNIKKIEYESQISQLEERLIQSQKEASKAKKELLEEKMNTNSLMRDINEKKTTINDLQNTVIHYVNIIENGQTKGSPQVDNQNSYQEISEERLLQIMQLKEEIRLNKEQFKRDLSAQADIYRQQMNIEKQKLIANLSSQSNHDPYKAIFQEYENKLISQKEEVTAISNELNRSWSAKYALLVQQYENRISSLLNSHEKEILTLKDSIQFEINKNRIRIELDLNSKFVETSRSYVDTISELEKEILSLNEKIDEMKYNNEKKENILKTKERRKITTSGSNTSVDKIFEHKVYEKYISKLNSLKKDLEGQHQWEIEQQRLFFSGILSKKQHESQISIRNIVLKLFQDIGNINDINNNQINMKEHIEALSDTLINLNSIQNYNNSFNDELIPLSEVQKRLSEMQRSLLETISFRYPQMINYNTHFDIKSDYISDSHIQKPITNMVYQLFFVFEIDHTDKKFLHTQCDQIMNMNKRKLELLYTYSSEHTLQTKSDFHEQSSKLSVSSDFYDFDHPCNFFGKSKPQLSISNSIFTSIEIFFVNRNLESLDCFEIVYSMDRHRKFTEKLVSYGIQQDFPPNRVTKSFFSANNDTNLKSNQSFSINHMQSLFISCLFEENPTQSTEVCLNEYSLNHVRHSSRRYNLSFYNQQIYVQNMIDYHSQIYEFPTLHISEVFQNHFPLRFVTHVKTAQRIIRYNNLFSCVKFDTIYIGINKSEIRIGDLKYFFSMDIRNDELISDQYESLIGNFQNECIEKENTILSLNKSINTLKEDLKYHKDFLRISNMKKPLKPIHLKISDGCIYEISLGPVSYQTELDSMTDIINPGLFKPTQIQSYEEGDSAFSLFQLCIDSISQIVENFNQYHGKILNDTIVFETFTEPNNAIYETQMSYINRMKDLNENIAKEISDLNQVQSYIHRFNTFLEKIKIKYEGIVNENIVLTENLRLIQYKFSNMYVEQICTKLDSEIQVTPNSSPQNSVLFVQSIIDSLELIKTLDLIFNETEYDYYNRLICEARSIEKQLFSSTIPDQSSYDSLLVSFKNFVSGILPSVKSSEELIHLMNNSNDSFHKLKHHHKKLKIKYAKMNRELKEEQYSRQVISEEIVTLKQRLSEAKEMNESTISLYQAQISILRDLFRQLTSHDQIDNNKSPLDLLNSIKYQVLSLQTLLETCRAERDMFKEKTDQKDDVIRLKELEIKDLIFKLEDAHLKLEQIDNYYIKSREQMLIHQISVDQMQVEKESDSVIVSQYKRQLEEAINFNNELSSMIRDHENEIRRLRIELRQANDLNNENQIKLSFGHYNRTKIPHLSKSTQVSTRVLNIKNDYTPQVEPKHMDQNEQINVLNGTHDISIPTNSHNDEIILESHNPSLLNESDSILELSIENPTEYSDLSNQCNVLPNDDIGSLYEIPEKGFDDDKYNADLITTSRPFFEHDVTMIGNQAVSHVHPPLPTPKPKRSPLFYVVGAKKNRNQSNKNQRPITAIARNSIISNPHDLNVGGIPSEPIPQSHSKKTPSFIHKQWSTPPKSNGLIPIIENSFKHRIPLTVPPSPNRPLSPIDGQKSEGDVNHISETVRITRILYHSDLQTPNTTPTKSPIILDPQCVSVSPNPLSQTPPSDLSGIHQMICKLRETNHNLQINNDDKDSLVAGLKLKIAELMQQIQRTRIDAINSEETKKKANIRYDFMKQRYDIMMKEYEICQETNHKLKKDLNRFISDSMPLNSSLNRMNKAQVEQRNLKKEQEKKECLLKVAKAAMEASSNNDTIHHLDILFTNTQRSLERIEMKKRIWKDIEKKQIIGALSAFSLMDQNPLVSISLISPYLNAYRFRTYQSKLLSMNNNLNTSHSVKDDIKVLQNFNNAGLHQNLDQNLSIRGKKSI